MHRYEEVAFTRINKEGAKVRNQQVPVRERGDDPRKSVSKAVTSWDGDLDREDTRNNVCVGLEIWTNVEGSFRQSSELLNSQIMHTGEKRFKCSECGKTFSQSTSLLVHERTHTGEKLYECSHCGRSFTHSSNLKTHEKIHAGDKPYACVDRGQTFYHSSSLMEHERIHTGENAHPVPTL